jgi:uncharacterized membrane protein YfcA
MELIISYFLALLVGITLGAVGSGGSILTLPILVYLVGLDPKIASGYSLFIVGVTALIGGVRSIYLKRIEYLAALVFGVPSIIAVLLTRSYIVPMIPDSLFSIGSFVVTRSLFLMLLFAVFMIAASISMIRPEKKQNQETGGPLKFNYPVILVEGLVVGVLTGLVGAGGGFLIVPALVILSKMNMKMAVGTSLLIIAAKSLIGFIGDVKFGGVIDWPFLLIFTGMSTVGIFIGMIFAEKINPSKLKKGFGWFILVMGIYILITELFTK